MQRFRESACSQEAFQGAASGLSPGVQAALRLVRVAGFADPGAGNGIPSSGSSGLPATRLAALSTKASGSREFRGKGIDHLAGAFVERFCHRRGVTTLQRSSHTFSGMRRPGGTVFEASRQNFRFPPECFSGDPDPDLWPLHDSMHTRQLPCPRPAL